MKLEGYRYVETKAARAPSTGRHDTVRMSPEAALRMSRVRPGTTNQLEPPQAILIDGEWVPVVVDEAVPPGFDLMRIVATASPSCTISISTVDGEGNVTEL